MANRCFCGLDKRFVPTLFLLKTLPGFQALHTPKGSLVDEVTSSFGLAGVTCRVTRAAAKANCFFCWVCARVLSTPFSACWTPGAALKPQPRPDGGAGTPWTDHRSLLDYLDLRGRPERSSSFFFFPPLGAVRSA